MNHRSSVPRLAPGVGVGYQWVETADFNFNTEAGVSYVYEDYSNDGNNDRVALRLAYHLDKKLNDKVSIFHNLEWLPAFDDPGDYNLNIDAGVKAHIDPKREPEKFRNAGAKVVLPVHITGHDQLIEPQGSGSAH